MGLLHDAVARQRERRDPLGRLPWPVRVLGLLLFAVLALGQLVIGQGASKLLGALLLVVVVPSQALGAYASWRISREG